MAKIKSISDKFYDQIITIAQVACFIRVAGIKPL
jgi:hypothetical protein